MLTSSIPPNVFWYLMAQQGFDAGNDVVSGTLGEGVDRSAVGKDIQQMNVHFDRASNWDPEREELTTLQRIRDLETFVFGDRRGLTIGVIRTMRHYLTWLIILSLFQGAALIIQAILVWAILRGS